MDTIVNTPDLEGMTPLHHALVRHHGVVIVTGCEQHDEMLRAYQCLNMILSVPMFGRLYVYLCVCVHVAFRIFSAGAVLPDHTPLFTFTGHDFQTLCCCVMEG